MTARRLKPIPASPSAASASDAGSGTPCTAARVLTSIDQADRRPTSLLNWSAMRSVQTPNTSWPSNADSSPSGRNEPLNGCEPAPIAVAASSSKTVWKLLPLPPRLSDRTTTVPPGLCSSICRSPSKLWLISMLAFRSVMTPWLPTSRVEVTVHRSQIATGTLVLAMTEARAEPARPRAMTAQRAERAEEAGESFKVVVR